MNEVTFFAPAVRSSSSQIAQELDIIHDSPTISTLMSAISGLLAILNQNREIIAVNHGFLTELGLSDVSELLGARLGEALHCVHAHEMNGGCGTSRYCSTCGAAIAMMKTLSEKTKNETLCAITTEKNGYPTDTALKVTTTPFEINGELFILLFVQDISREQEWQVIEQLFFHDFNNILCALTGASELLKYGPPDIETVEIINKLAWRMKREIDVQRVLFRKNIDDYDLEQVTYSVREIFDELASSISSNNQAESKAIVYDSADISITTDKTLLLKILLNMTLNAIEAISAGDSVKVSCYQEPGATVFSVWNRSVIPSHLQKRVFQRYFSTKAFSGRGLGSYSIKLFGERFLGGKVWFTSVDGEGTTFYLRLPNSQTGDQ